MTTVVDVSVALKWILNEPGAKEARAVLKTGAVSAPDFLLVEAANVLWRDVRRGVMDREHADQAFEIIANAGVAMTPAVEMLPAARSVAAGVDVTVYDALYVALAQQAGAALATADQRLADKVERSGLRIPVTRIG